MNPNLDFLPFASAYFGRLVGGYARSLDHTQVRAWINGDLCLSDEGGAFDACTRMSPALAAWIGSGRQPFVTDPRRGQSVDVAGHLRTLFANAFDPANPGYWGFNTPNPACTQTLRHQHIVEASILAYSAWLLRDSILPALPTPHLARFQAWLEYFGRELHHNNWQLFTIVNQSARQALGWEFSPQLLDQAWAIIDRFERQEGWMTDGSEGYFDDYNWWVFGSHELMWLQMVGDLPAYQAQAQRVRQRVQKRLEVFPYFFAADGGYCEFGRSLSYKFARLGFPLLAYRLGLWPHATGMLKRLVRRHLAWYDTRGAIDRATDTVRQELTAAGSREVRDPYINSGHPYWCMLAFAGLWQIPDSDPFWTIDEEPLPVENSDFSRTITAAGWMLEGVRNGGHVLRYAIGSRHVEATYAPFAAKYSKFCYGSAFPVDIGLADNGPSPDAALCLTDGNHFAHPGTYDNLVVADGFVSAMYGLMIGARSLACRTTLVPFGDVCVRLHRVTVDASDRTGDLQLIEGASAVGFAPGELPRHTVSQNPVLSAAHQGLLSSAILHHPTETCPDAQARAPRRLGANMVHAFSHVPHLWRTVQPGTQRIISVTLASAAGWRDFTRDVQITPARDGSLIVTHQARSVQIPASCA